MSVLIQQNDFMWHSFFFIKQALNALHSFGVMSLNKKEKNSRKQDCDSRARSTTTDLIIEL